MTKKTTPEQDEIIAALGSHGQDLQEVRSREDEIMKTVHSWIRKGFEAGISGYKISKESGLSLPRVYQIRDQVKAETSASPAQASSTAE